jgi:hypothetical protein
MRLFIPLALLSLVAACSGQYDPDICTTGGPETPHLEHEAKACVQRQGRALAPSPGDARDVADAVLAECSGILLSDGAAGKDNKSETAGGEGSNAQWAEARELALFRVVEERAGHCSLKK